MRKDGIAQVRHHALTKRDHKEITQARSQSEGKRQQHQHTEVIIDEDRIRAGKTVIDHAPQRHRNGKGRDRSQHQ